jgi:hypothetical protein
MFCFFLKDFVSCDELSNNYSMEELVFNLRLGFDLSWLNGSKVFLALLMMYSSIFFSLACILCFIRPKMMFWALTCLTICNFDHHYII